MMCIYFSRNLSCSCSWLLHVKVYIYTIYSLFTYVDILGKSYENHFSLICIFGVSLTCEFYLIYWTVNSNKVSNKIRFSIYLEKSFLKVIDGFANELDLNLALSTKFFIIVYSGIIDFAWCFHRYWKLYVLSTFSVTLLNCSSRFFANSFMIKY